MAEKVRPKGHPRSVKQKMATKYNWLHRRVLGAQGLISELNHMGFLTKEEAKIMSNTLIVVRTRIRKYFRDLVEKVPGKEDLEV